MSGFLHPEGRPGGVVSSGVGLGGCRKEVGVFVLNGTGESEKVRG